MRTNILFLFTMLMVGFIFASCNSKSKTTAEAKAIVGKWEFSNVRLDIKTSDSAATAKLTAKLTKLTKDMPYFAIEFTNDGKVNGTEYNATYAISEDKITITYNNKAGYVSEFKVNGDTLLFIVPVGNIINENLKRTLDISDSVKIEKAVSITNLVRKK